MRTEDAVRMVRLIAHAKLPVFPSADAAGAIPAARYTRLQSAPATIQLRFSALVIGEFVKGTR